jgi:hypothetical protein
MIELLKNIVCLESDGQNHVVPVEEYDFVYKDIDLGDPSQGSLPRIDVYQFDDCHSVHLWAIEEAHIFQMKEQVMHKFDPRYQSQYSIESINWGKNGLLQECRITVVNASSDST